MPSHGFLDKVRSVRRTIAANLEWWMVVPVVIVCGFAVLWRHYQLDDALIYLRYVKNFQAGHGLVYNPGEKFNGLTSPLFTYAMVALSFVSSHLQVLTIALSAACFAGAAVVGAQVFSTSRSEALFTSVVIASCSYFYSTFGMETSLFLLLIAVSLRLRRASSPYVLVALALLIITRAEGVFLALPILVEYAMQRRVPPRRVLAIAIAVLLAPLAVNRLYYGSALPATASAKFGQGRSGYWGEHFAFFRLGYFRDWYFSGSIVAVVLLGATALAGVALLMLARDRVAMMAVAFFVLLFGFYAALNMPNYHWYYAPFMFLLLLFACRAVCRGAAIVIRGLRTREWKPIAVLLLPLVALVVFVGTKVVSLDGGGRKEQYAGIGVWIRANSFPEATVGLVEIGTVGWYSDRRIVDILGLVTPDNADAITHRDVYSWLEREQPDLILRHEPRWAFEEATVVLEQSGAYVPVEGLSAPGFVLLEKSGTFTDEQIADLAASARARR